ncbi:hypothetical protein FPV16_09270 [Methylobacterium sp. W2]|uniref:hypothetical protein n=1 Tax=Methylobacterium sp. W2 TaxID=2598107 RepID=UPI001D0CC308|nr:hypothetical protein [Methylobacterium sp. W2]MCC0806403.1 hypothetical protein [Methylobacterium sp. W2]
MILALFALAVVMIVGGIASVVQGFPYVRLESGWTMTIAGAATASSGALLLGLAVVATYLKRLERVLLEQGAGLGVDPSVFEARGRIEPPGLDTADAAEEPVSPGRQRPSAVGLAEPRLASPPHFADEAPLGSDPASPLLPDLLPEPPPPPVEDARQNQLRAVEPDAEAAPARRIKPNKPPRAVKPTAMVDTVIPAPEPVPPVVEAPPAPVALPPAPPREADREEPLGLRSSVVDEPETVPSPAPPEEADPAASLLKGGLAVVGTYASGGNTYVMYSNGSIEADTPRGQFTFDSLDELKAFVEAGGEEGAARGAA